MDWVIAAAVVMVAVGAALIITGVRVVSVINVEPLTPSPISDGVILISQTVDSCVAHLSPIGFAYMNCTPTTYTRVVHPGKATFLMRGVINVTPIEVMGVPVNGYSLVTPINRSGTVNYANGGSITVDPDNGVIKVVVPVSKVEGGNCTLIVYNAWEDARPCLINNETVMVKPWQHVTPKKTVALTITGRLGVALAVLGTTAGILRRLRQI